MAKFFFLPYYVVLNLILLLFTSGTLISTVKGEICSEDIGPCDDTCNSKCTSKYPTGKGSCDASTATVPICRCYYECGAPSPPSPPPKHKTCNVGIGTCSAACNDQCCNENCAAKFPGLQEGHGTCYNIGPSIYNYCLCLFNC